MLEANGIFKIGAALEYLVQEALRAGRISGALNPSKRCRIRVASLSPSPTPEAVAGSAAAGAAAAGAAAGASAGAAAGAAPGTEHAIRLVFVHPEVARPTDGGARFPYFWPRSDNTLVRSISSMEGQTLHALAAPVVADMPFPDREIRSIWGVTEDEPDHDGVLPVLASDAPRDNRVYILDSDAAVKGWLAQTANLTERTVYVVFRRTPDDPRENTPLPGDRPFFSCAAVVPREREVYFDIAEDEDDELRALKKEPRSLPWTRAGLKKKERIVLLRIARQERLLQALRARALGFYDDWQDSEVEDDEIEWMAENRYIVDPPEPGSEPLPRS